MSSLSHLAGTWQLKEARVYSGWGGEGLSGITTSHSDGLTSARRAMELY